MNRWLMVLVLLLCTLVTGTDQKKKGFLKVGHGDHVRMSKDKVDLKQILKTTQNGQDIDLIKVCEAHKKNPGDRDAIYNLIEEYRLLKRHILLSPNYSKTGKVEDSESGKKFKKNIDFLHEKRNKGKVKHAFNRWACQNLKNQNSETCKKYKEAQNQVTEFRQHHTDKQKLNHLEKMIIQRTGVSQKTVQGIPVARLNNGTAKDFPCERTDIRTLGIVDLSKKQPIDMNALEKLVQQERKINAIEGRGVLSTINLICSEQKPEKSSGTAWHDSQGNQANEGLKHQTDQKNIRRIMVETGMSNDQIHTFKQTCQKKWKDIAPKKMPTHSAPLNPSQDAFLSRYRILDSDEGKDIFYKKVGLGLEIKKWESELRQSKYSSDPNNPKMTGATKPVVSRLSAGHEDKQLKLIEKAKEMYKTLEKEQKERIGDLKELNPHLPQQTDDLKKMYERKVRALVFTKNKEAELTHCQNNNCDMDQQSHLNNLIVCGQELVDLLKGQITFKEKQIGNFDEFKNYKIDQKTKIEDISKIIKELEKLVSAWETKVKDHQTNNIGKQKNQKQRNDILQLLVNISMAKDYLKYIQEDLKKRKDKQARKELRDY